MLTIKNPAELVKMRKAGYIVAEVLALMSELVKPGITTKDLDIAAEKLTPVCPSARLTSC